MTVRLGLPSKGRLQEDAIDWFAERGLRIERARRGREYGGRVTGLPNVDLVLLPAAEMPRELAFGRVDLGVTGQDLVRETLPAWNHAVAEVAPLGFGFADLVVAVPAFWIDVLDMADLDAVAADFRALHGHRLRVATKYHRLVRDFFRSHGIADYALVDSQGATEGTVKNGAAEAVADITSSGSTLRDNHLKTLRDGTILRSQATLFVSREATSDALEVIEALGLGRPKGLNGR